MIILTILRESAMFFNYKMKFLLFTVTVSALLISSVKTDEDDYSRLKMLHYNLQERTDDIETDFLNSKFILIYV